MSRHERRRQARHITQSGSVYERAVHEMNDLLYDTYGQDWDHLRIERLSGVIEQMKRRVEHTDSADKPARLIALLLLQAPRAARAQDAMDKRHGHGYHHRSKRLYELIDFNDTFVDAVLSLPSEDRRDFVKTTYALMKDVCRRARTHMFTYEQFEAIAHGLSREIAVYLGAQAEGLEVHMTSRVADGLGVDMQIRQPETGRYINIDCKTTSAYGHRVSTLEYEGRISERAATLALAKGYIRIANGHGDERVLVVLFRVTHEIIGEIRNFEFVETHILAQKINEMIVAYGEAGDGFYRYVDD